MSTSIVECPDIVIADGETISSSLSADLDYGDSDLITIIAPSNATAGVIHVSDDGTTFVALQSVDTGAVADVASPAASKARTYAIVARYFRIVSAAVTGDATYKVNKRVTHSS